MDSEARNVVMKRQRTHASGQRSSKMLQESDAELSHDKSAQSTEPTMSHTLQSLPPRGRKRFMADLSSATNACKAGFVVEGLQIKGTFTMLYRHEHFSFLNLHHESNI
jgi:hypothetical protein